MAYATKYRTGSEFKDPYSDELIEMFVAIKEKDYSGSITDYKGSFDTFKVNRDYQDQGVQQHILGTSFEFTLQFEDGDFFAPMDLMTATERQFQVEVTCYVDKIFQGVVFLGYLNVDNSERKYLQYGTLHLLASSYLSKLKHYTPTLIDTEERVTYIDVISAMLSELGSTDNIRVRCPLVPEEDYGLQSLVDGNPGYSGFNKAGFFTELFWENNVETKKSYDILNEILKSMNCYIYWWDNTWYIERYNNIWVDGSTKWFVEYDITQSYSPDDNGIWRSEDVETYNLHETFLFIEQSQKLRTIPGLRKIAIKINDKMFDNMVRRQFTPFTLTNDVFPDISVREWYGFKQLAGYINWENVDMPYKDIERSVTKTNSDPTQYANGGESMRGLYSNFRVSVQNGTQINLSWKYNVGEDADSWNPEANYVFKQYWALRITDLEDDSLKAVVLDTSGWEEDKGWILSKVDPSLSWLHLISNKIEVKQENFDRDTKTISFSTSIPIHKLNEEINSGDVTHSTDGGDTYKAVVVPVTLPFSGNYKMQLVVGEVVRFTAFSGIGPLPDPRYGDIEVSASGEKLDDNYIEGTINTDFLNEKDINITLADQSNFNYMNGILRGSTLEARTTNWQSGISDTPRPLADRLLEDKFRFYNVTRNRVAGNIKDTMLWRPFTQIVDEKRSNLKFLLVGTQFKINIAAYDILLMEYDNETEVNLVEES